MFYLFVGQVLQVLLYYLTGKKPLFLLPSFILPSWRTWKPFFFVFLLHGKLNSSLYIPKRVPIILSHLYEPGTIASSSLIYKVSSSAVFQFSLFSHLCHWMQCVFDSLFKSSSFQGFQIITEIRLLQERKTILFR